MTVLGCIGLAFVLALPSCCLCFVFVLPLLCLCFVCFAFAFQMGGSLELFLFSWTCFELILGQFWVLLGMLWESPNNVPMQTTNDKLAIEQALIKVNTNINNLARSKQQTNNKDEIA
jgi:hypothetical protein